MGIQWAKGEKKIMKGEEIVALISAIGTIVVALVSIYTSRKKEKTDERSILINAITQNRMTWISTVRDSMKSFCIAFKEKPSDKAELCKLKTELFLYMRYDRNAYLPFMEIVNICCREYISPALHDLIYERLILTSQYALATVWIRIKEEGARGETDDGKINEIVSEKTKKLIGHINENREQILKLPNSEAWTDKIKIRSNKIDT